MPVKILLADKSITIQKVVEMLFSGKEYEVICVSDGESALSEASRALPDVVLADVDLPRIDGYSFAGRLRQTPSLARTPVILMLSRDDVYDAAKGKEAGIVDSIAKPFESQELIGKVKKALSAAPSRPAPAARPAAPPSPRPEPAASPPPSKPKQAVPSDIFDIIQEAPTRAEVKQVPTPSRQAAAEETIFEVEPEVELEAEIISEPPKKVPPAGRAPEKTAVEWKPPEREPAMRAAKPAQQPMPLAGEPAETELEAEIIPETSAKEDSLAEERLFGAEAVPGPPMPEAEKALPLGEKAVEEMRAGLGLAAGPKAEETMSGHPDIVSFESLDVASRVSHADYTPAGEETVAPGSARGPEPRYTAPPRAPEISEEMLRSVVQEVVERVARDVVERVAWEVIPDLAERLIREEIERLKAET